MTLTRPTFTVSQAADLCQVSRKSVTRRMSALQAHGAAKDSLGQWVIPVEALLAVGLRPGRPSGPTQGEPGPPPDVGHVSHLVEPVTPTAVVAEMAEYRRRAEVAEAERDGLRALVDAERSRADALDFVLRHQLTAAVTPVTTSAVAVPVQSPPTIEPEQERTSSTTPSLWRRFLKRS